MMQKLYIFYIAYMALKAAEFHNSELNYTCTILITYIVLNGRLIEAIM